MLKPALFLAGSALLLYQVSTIGLANNGDFPRIAGRLSLCPEGGWDQNRFTFFVPRYTASPACYWDSQVPTSALPIFRIARRLDVGPVFQIRYVGFLQAAMLLPLLWLMPWAGLLFLDLSYIAYFNSFYLEAASLLFLLATVAAALRKNAYCYTAAALLLVTCKTQHAWLAVPLSAYALYAFRSRLWSLLTTASLLTAAVWITAATPLDYKASNLWNSVFISLLPSDPHAFASLNVSSAYAPFIGRNAYQFPDQPTADRYIRAFYAEAGYRSLLRYYIAHPDRAARRAWDSAAQLHHVRPSYLGIYERGSPRWPTYSWWSNGKSALYLHAPWLAVILYAGTFVVLWRSPHRPLLLLLLAMAAMEFTLSCFADSILDYRHHFLFHAITDVWLCFAAAEFRFRKQAKIS